ncbi:MAG: hypothetical protein ACWA41_04570 [Putridiphycobacter sp.]
MLEGKEIKSFEKAVFLSENPYLNNKYSFENFEYGINQHIFLIEKLIKANNQSDSLDFSTEIDRSKPYDVRSFRYTSEEKKELYQKALTNWAIFTYMTDTIELPYSYHYPFSYQIEDPFGMKNWKHSQVTNLLTSDNQKGNCLSLVSLFKIFSERLNSDAIICTAPGHIYLRHKDEKGFMYNVELATASHPGDGSIRTLTYTHKEALMNNIALRQLSNEQNIALCLVNLGKSFERKFNTQSDDFILKCAETALKYDSLSLNAHLLKLQVLEVQVINYALKHQLSLEELKLDKVINNVYNALEKQIILLYNLGYRQMPMDMQEMVLAGLQKEEDAQAILVKDRTPNPFTSIQPKDKSDIRYSTLSGGIYPEVHENKSIEVYGRLAFDTDKKQIVTFDTSSTYGLLIDPVAFAWSIDPYATIYPSWSPYVAFADNPIYYIDPDGGRIRPTNSKAKKVFEKGLDNVFAKFPEIRKHIKYDKVSNGVGNQKLPISAFIYEMAEDKETGTPKLSFSDAKKAIKKSEKVSRDEKLIALAYLKVIEEENITEFQTPYNEPEKSFHVLSDDKTNNFHAQQSRSSNVDLTQNKLDATGSNEGESDFKPYSNNDTKIFRDLNNDAFTINGLYNFLPTEGNPEQTQSALNRTIVHMSGGVKYTENKPSSKGKKYYDKHTHRVDKNAKFSTTVEQIKKK